MASSPGAGGRGERPPTARLEALSWQAVAEPSCELPQECRRAKSLARDLVKDGTWPIIPEALRMRPGAVNRGRSPASTPSVRIALVPAPGRRASGSLERASARPSVDSRELPGMSLSNCRIAI